MKNLEEASQEWWDSLSTDVQKIKRNFYCMCKNIPEIHFDISCIIKMFQLEHPHLITSAEQVQKIMDDIFSKPNKNVNSQKGKFNYVKLSVVESQLLKNQKIIMESLHKLVEKTSLSIEKELEANIIATDAILKLS